MLQAVVTVPAEVRATFRGPLFKAGQVTYVLADIQADIARRLVVEGERRVLAMLDASLRHPTGAYRKRITAYGPVGGQGRIHDQQGIYGPWLNGTGSRNRRSRFRGYGHFKKTQQALERGAKPLARQVVADHLYKLGG